MTNRARWILAIAICGMVLGILSRISPFAILNLIFISWIGIEWFAFRLKTLRAHKLFSEAVREIDGNAAESLSLSLNEDYEVTLRVVFHRQLQGLRFFLSDLVPGGILSTDRFPAVVDLQHQFQVQWKYRITPQVTGQLALPGLQVTVTDAYGFFRHQQFVPLRQKLTLLPFVIQPQSTAERIKRDNLQLMTGHHRFRKPGISSELLGIREYQKGDPPRSIAWKATARTGKLMTCEYESEVPIRATILADVSGYQFWGRPGPAPFDAIASAVGSFTRLLIEDKDPVGLILASAANSTRLRPGLGQRQLVRVFQAMMNSHPGSLAATEFSIHELELFVWRSLYRIFPDLLEDRLNVVRVPMLLFGPRRRYEFRIRRQTSVALSWIFGQSLARGYQLTYDDQAYRDYCNRFFDSYPSAVNEASLVADFGLGRQMKELTVRTIGDRLLESVARAQDNELFILVGDFHVRPHGFQHLLNAIRVARSRFHRVMVVTVPASNVAATIGDPTALQAFDYIQSINSREGLRHDASFQQLGALIAPLDDVKLMEKLAGELKILKTGGSRGASVVTRVGD